MTRPMANSAELLMQLLAVGGGGCLGAWARYAINGGMHRWLGTGFPWGTLTVNLLGCLAIGGAMGWVLQGRLPAAVQALLITGFLGSLTTFSTFGWQTLQLMREGRFPSALGNVLANLLIGMTAVWVGLWLSGSRGTPSEFDQQEVNHGRLDDRDEHHGEDR